MSSPLTITQRRAGDVVIFVLSGHLVAYEGTRTLRDAVKSAVAAGTRACLLDLDDVSYVDSAGVGMLVEIYRHVTGHGGQVKLLHPSICARRVLGISHLTAVFDVFDNEAEALLNLAGAGLVPHS
jgi:anti-sigma B factor antagonist